MSSEDVRIPAFSCVHVVISRPDASGALDLQCVGQAWNRETPRTVSQLKQ